MCDARREHVFHGLPYGLLTGYRRGRREGYNRRDVTLGMLYLTQHLPLPRELQLSLSITIGLISLGLVGFVAFQRYGLLSKLVHGLRHLRLGQERLQRLNQHLIPLDAQLVTYSRVIPSALSALSIPSPKMVR